MPRKTTRRRRPSTKLLALKRKAKREGWARWLRAGAGEEADERALLAGCWFDVRRGQHFVDYCERYATLTEGAFAGQPFALQTWQHDFGQRLFGWQRYSPEWGFAVRRFQEAYLEVPKKNGKTPFAATVGKYLFFADSHGRQINLYTAATTKKRAQDLNAHAMRQIANSAELSALAQIVTVDGWKEIHYRDNVWRVLPATEEGADGVNGSVISDEVHMWQGFVFYNALRWALASQPEGLFLGITTAGRNSESVCKTLHDKTMAVLAGIQVDERFLGEIHAADPAADPHDERTWRAANPSLGTGRDSPLKLSDFRADYVAARDNPRIWPEWKQKRLNIWRTAEEAWVDELGGIELWDAGSVARRGRRSRIDCYQEFTPADFRGRLCDLAIDTASVRDTAAATFSFVDEEDPRIVYVLPLFWLPERRAIELDQRAPYRRFAESGELKLTPGDAVDFDTIFADLLEFGQTVHVRTLYADPKFQAEWLTQRLAGELGCERVAFDQTNANYAAPVATAERLLLERLLRHNGNQLLTWQLGHARMYVDSRGYKRPLKQRHGDIRTVDGVQTLIMSLHRIADRDAPKSYYDDEENEVEFI